MRPYGLRHVDRKLFAFLLVTSALLLCAQDSSRARFVNLDMTSGLSQSSVYAMAQDAQGFLWVGTQGGLNRYDGYHFKNYNHDLNNSTSLTHDRISSLVGDKLGALWVGTNGGGLNRYDPRSDRFHAIGQSPKTVAIGARIFSLVCDTRGLVWVGSEQGLFRIDPANEKITAIDFGEPGAPPESVRAILLSKDGTLWLGTAQHGVCQISQEGAVLRWIQPDQGLSDPRVRSLCFDLDQQLWIATEAGLNRFSPSSGEIHVYLKQADNSTSLCGNTVRSVFCDQQGQVWVGTNQGLCRWQKGLDGFDPFLNDPTLAQSMPSEDILSLYEDKSGVVWIGSHGGLSKWNASYNIFRGYTSSPNKPGLSSPVVTAFAEDRENHLWIGTYGGGLNRMDRTSGVFKVYRKEDGLGLNENQIGSLFLDSRGSLWVGGFKNGLFRYEADKDTFTAFSHNPDEPQSLSANSVTAISEDAKGQFLLVGTKDGGLNQLDRATGLFERLGHDPEQKDSLSCNTVVSIGMDPKGNAWLGTEQGLNRFDETHKRFQAFHHDPLKPESISADMILTIAFDQRETMWLGTMGGGLDAWEASDYQAGHEAFRHFGPQDGLPSNTVYGILPGKAGQLWMSTNKGLVLMDTFGNTFKKFHRLHGLLSEEFNAGSYFRARDGQLYFGGLKGFNSFDPKEVRMNTQEPTVVLLDFLLANQSVPLKAEDPNSPLAQTVGFTDKITLTHLDRVFAIEYAGLHYVDPSQSQYAYRMIGLSTDWIVTDASNQIATYTTLKPGEYEFQVKASNNDGVWNESGASLKIRILPPAWRSPLAYSLYSLALLGSIVTYTSFQRRRLAEKQAVIEQLQEIDQLKDNFLANTSHELRTPLNGIIGLAESLADGAVGPLNEMQIKNLKMVASSGRRLSSLVDNILDFSKARSMHLEFQSLPQNLYSVVDSVLALTRPLLDNKGVRLVNQVPVDLPAVLADGNRLIQILHNLIGNAVKFTQAGSVLVGAEATDTTVTFWVQDTGIGIAPQDQELIFESFRQIEASNERKYAGTGLGLAITRQLVELQQGTIWVESELGQGASFFVALPRAQEAATSEAPELTALGNQIMGFEEELSVELPEPATRSRFTILIVDDEPINRQVLVNYLTTAGYSLLEAESGRSALSIVASQKVDLILLDVMMPLLSGYDVCRTLRTQYPMHVLPIIFLTARNQLSDLTTGFSVGGNDYFTKPISKQALICRVRTHLELLELTRTMEARVHERTCELKEQNEQMKTLDRIVKTVNREMTLQRVLQVLLEQCMSLFSQAEKAAFLALDRSSHRFDLAASVGHDIGLRFENGFTLEELMQRYTAGAEQVDRGVYLVREVRELQGRNLPKPLCLLTMVVTLEEEMVGVMVFSNFSDKHAFDHSDLRKLGRIREHAVSALAKARYLEELEAKNVEILHTQNQLILREKMVSLGTLTAGIAHEIKNPLNFINNFGILNKDLAVEGLKLIEEQELGVAWEEERRAQMLEILTSLGENAVLIDKHGKKANHIVQSIMMLSRDSAGEKQHYPLNDLVEEYTYLAYSGIQARDARVTFSIDLQLAENVEDCLLVVQSMGRAIVSLVNNAIEAVLDRLTKEPQGYQPLLQVLTERSGDMYLIRVRDNGIGVPKDLRGKIFTPFFTTRSPETNIGLGLFISYDTIVQEHRGGLILSEEQAEVTEFCVTLPIGNQEQDH